MDAINPIAGSLMQSPAASAQQSLEKTRHVRRMQLLEKDVAAEDEQLEHQVENSQEVVEIHDEDNAHPENQRRRKKPEADEPSGDQPPGGLDLTA